MVPWLRSSANKVQTNVFCCCLIVNYGVTLHRTCYTIVCIVPWCPSVYKTSIASIQSIGFTVTGFFGVLLEVLGIFLGLTFGSIGSSPSLEIPSSPPPLGTATRDKLLWETESQSNLASRDGEARQSTKGLRISRQP